jgi:hypothetical protein
MKNLKNHKGYHLAIILSLFFFTDLMGAINENSFPRFTGTAYTDQLNFIDQNSTEMHHLKTKGQVSKEKTSVEMGRLLSTTEALTVQAKGSCLEFQLKCQPQQALILEIQEIHQRRSKAFGYTISVNHQKVYFRTYEEYGAGPNHFFVRVDANIIGDHHSAKIEIVNVGETAFGMGNIWSYSEFFNKIVPEENISLKMPLYTHLSNDESHQRIVKTPYECYGPIGKLGFVTYGNQNLEETRLKFHKTLDESSSQQTPYMFIISGYGWGGLPTGPDGLGGYFSDPRYSGLSYSPSTQKYRASWPNMWGSTPFLTITDPNMNQYLKQRIDRIMGDFPEKIDTYKAMGMAISPILVKEWGSNGGEVTNENILAAQRDGVTLDPSDGLSAQERHWLYQHVSEIWQGWANDMSKLVGRESVFVNQGNVQLPQYQMINNMYSHPDFITDHPMNNPRWNAGQMGMVKGFWSSGEMGRGTEYREVAMYDYIRANGRLAMVNMERTMLKDNFSVLKNHYQRGFQFLTFFNSYDGDEKFIKSTDGFNHETCLPPVHKEPLILDINLERDQNFGDATAIHSNQNLSLQNKLRLAVENIQQQGEVIYRLDNSGGDFESGLVLHIDGRISPDAGNAIEVYTGNELSKLKLIKTLTSKDLPCPDHWTPYMSTETSVDLGENMIGFKKTFLRLVIKATKAPDAAFILGIKVGFQWPMLSGQLKGRDFEIGEMRALQLWVQERAVSKHLLTQYLEYGVRDANLQKAEKLIEQGWYKSANRFLSGAISQLLPARYVIKGYGALGNYPIEVKLTQNDEAVSLTLNKFSNKEIFFKIQPLSGAAEGIITFSQLDPSKSYCLSRDEDHQYRLVEGEPSLDGPMILEDNKVSFKLNVNNLNKEDMAVSTLPIKLVARCLAINKKTITVDIQDVKTMNYDNSLILPLAIDVSIERHNDNPLETIKSQSTWPEPLDEVQLTLNSEGHVTHIIASYGHEKGRLKKYYPPVLVGEISTGILEFENGRKYSLHYDKSTGTVCDTVALKGPILNYEFQALENIFKPGQEYEFTYSPYAEKDGVPRIRNLRQDYHIIFNADYTKIQDDGWKKKTIFHEGLDVTAHHPEPNYLAQISMQLLRPTTAFDTGTIVYHINSESTLKNTVVEFTARAFEDSSVVEFWVSADNKMWEKSGQFDNTWQNNIPQSINSKTMSLPWQFIDISPWVKDRKDFYLKLVLRVNSADERYCVAAVRVVTED